MEDRPPTGGVAEGHGVAASAVPVVGKDGDLIFHMFHQARQGGCAKGPWDRDLEKGRGPPGSQEASPPRDRLTGYGQTDCLKIQDWDGHRV
jgi:hypothetical protein